MISRVVLFIVSEYINGRSLFIHCTLPVSLIYFVRVAMSNNIPINIEPPHLTIRPLTKVKVNGEVSPFVQGELGVTPACVAGIIQVQWHDPALVPLYLEVKLVVKERSTTQLYSRGDASNTDVHLSSILQRNSLVLWAPKGLADDDGDDDESGSERSDIEALTEAMNALSPEHVQETLRRGLIERSFSIPISEHLPGTVCLPCGSIEYKLKTTLVYRLGQRPVSVLKQKELLTVPRRGLRAATSLFTLTCAIDENTTAIARLLDNHIYSGGTSDLCIRLQIIDEAKPSLLDVKGIRVALYRTDTYRHAIDTTLDEEKVSDTQPSLPNQHTNASDDECVSSHSVLVTEMNVVPMQDALLCSQGQLIHLNHPQNLIASFSSVLLTSSYTYIVQVDFEDRYAEFFFPVKCIVLQPDEHCKDA
jgi:hypothetical protein